LHRNQWGIALSFDDWIQGPWRILISLHASQKVTKNRPVEYGVLQESSRYSGFWETVSICLLQAGLQNNLWAATTKQPSMKRTGNYIYLEDGGDIQATGEPVDCRSLTSPPPLDSSKLYIMNEFSQWINNATSSLKSSPLIFECIRSQKTTLNENF